MQILRQLAPPKCTRTTPLNLLPRLFTTSSRSLERMPQRYDRSVRFDRVPRKLPPHVSIPKLLPDHLSYYWDTTPPTKEQLLHASKFFKFRPPTFLWSAAEFKNMDFGDSPEVCVLGRSNVGKSSLLNTLLCKRIANTSSKRGRTKLMNAFAVGGAEDNGKNRLVVLDMPGYGKGGRSEWGREILKYLGKRRQLKRAFLLLDASHGIKKSDKQIIELFKELSVPYQIIFVKVDRILFVGSRREPSQTALKARITQLRTAMEDVRDLVQPTPEDDGLGVGEVLACSSERWLNGERMGIDAVRFAMLQAADLQLERRTRLVRMVETIPFEEIYKERPGES
ncbi:hypothetical protein HYFRA_00003826 [Hymenoscyphus fraxineus]|uniref:EngB-type G domain-containing protein n=1 Tax=Hymenoscyphus fraxineus TaxID=746836 RepID=A0A9N9L3P8_9HELO|nr:hypothetical protein HYFRA_00003826 [Hymenoscyphus fraxineus]